MTDFKDLSISFHGEDSLSSSGFALELYQEINDELLGYPSYADINAMISYARSGKSAFYVLTDNSDYASFDGADVIINLPFFVRPYPSNLVYNFTHNVQSLSTMEIIDKEYKSTIVMPMSNRIDFPTEVAVSELMWKSSAYNSSGEVVAYPDYYVSENSIIFDDSVFVVMKVTYTLIEHKYVATIRVPKESAGGISNEISGLKPVVIAAYNDEEGENQVEQLDLQYPAIVTDMLTACPNDSKELIIDWSTSNIDKDTSTIYYYSTCTGDIIGTVRR